jgi:hypothetical protein
MNSKFVVNEELANRGFLEAENRLNYANFKQHPQRLRSYFLTVAIGISVSHNILSGGFIIELLTQQLENGLDPGFTPTR